MIFKNSFFFSSLLLILKIHACHQERTVKLKFRSLFIKYLNQPLNCDFKNLITTSKCVLCYYHFQFKCFSE